MRLEVFCVYVERIHNERVSGRESYILGVKIVRS